MLSPEAFVRRALLLPLAIPLVVGVLALLAPDLFGILALFLGGSLLYAGLAYLFFAVGMYRLTRGMTWPRVKRLALVAPLLFAPLAGINSTFFFAAGAPASLAEGRWIQNFIGGAGLAVVFGYVYVLLTFMAERVRYRSIPLNSHDLGEPHNHDSAT